MIIVLDSTEFTRDFTLRSTAFRTLLRSAKKLSFVLALSDVVLREVVGNRAREIQSLRDKAKALAKKVHALEGHTVGLDDIRFESDDGYRDWLREQLSDCDFIELPIVDVPHANLVDRAIARHKPFNEAGSGYRDALIWLSLLEVLRKNEVPVVFVSANSKDFGDPPELHGPLKQDIVDAGVPIDRLMYFANLQSFVDQYIVPRLDVVENIREQLQAGTLDGFSVDEWLSTGLVDALEAAGAIEVLSPVDASHVSTVSARVESVKSYDVEAVTHLPGGDYLVRGRTELVLAVTVQAGSHHTKTYEDVRNWFGVRPGVLARGVYGADLTVSFRLVLAEKSRELISADVDHFTSMST